MDVVIGWPDAATFDRTTANRVLSLCAYLVQRGSLGRVVAAMPPPGRVEDCARLFALAGSLRRVGAPALAVLADVSRLEPTDLDNFLDMGIREFIMLAGEGSVRAALQLIVCSRLSGTESVRVRLWLERSRAGEFQRYITAWRSAFPFVIEASPAPFPVELTVPLAPRRCELSPRPLRCAWLRSVLTISNTGTLVPCPLHVATGHHRPLEWAEADGPLQARWAELLGESSICSSCALAARFDGSGLDRNNAGKIVSTQAEYFDHVGEEAGKLPESELSVTITAFATRIAASARGDRS
jgi:hypothetical protein